MTSSNIVMKGEGFYSAVSLGPQAAIDYSKKAALSAIRSMDLSNTDKPFVIADYGSADGGLSMGMICELVAEIRSRAPRRPISVYSTDLPDLDFRTLFQRLADENSKSQSYLSRFENIYAFATGISFYRQIFPDASVNLGFSSSAMHYLSSMPGPLNDHLHPACSTDPSRNAFREQAIEDWQQILQHRASELATDGRLIFNILGVDEDGRFLGNTIGANLFDTYYDIWTELWQAGEITYEEHSAACFQQYYKDCDETCAPFLDKKNSVVRAGLKLETVETHVVECPFQAAYHAGLSVQEFAQQFVNTHRSWTETVFYNALNDKRSLRQKDEIVDSLYQRFTRLVLENPRHYRKDLVHIYLTISKTGNRPGWPVSSLNRDAGHE